MEYISDEKLIELGKRFDFLLGMECLYDIEEDPDAYRYTGLKYTAEDQFSCYHDLRIPIGWYDLFVEMCEEIEEELNYLESIGWFKNNKDERKFYHLFYVNEYDHKMICDWIHFVDGEEYEGYAPPTIIEICEQYENRSFFIDMNNGVEDDFFLLD